MFEEINKSKKLSFKKIMQRVRNIPFWQKSMKREYLKIPSMYITNDQIKILIKLLIHSVHYRRYICALI